MLAVLVGIAMLAIFSMGSSARNWISLWQGFDQLSMSLDAVEVLEDNRRITVDVTVVNNSDETLQVHVLETGLRLDGRSVTGGSQRFEEFLLEPGESASLQTTQQVTGDDVAFLSDRRENPNATWNVNGRLQVSVEGLSEPQWLPFRYNMDVHG